MAGVEAWSVVGVASSLERAMNVPSVPSDIAPPCLLSQEPLKKEKKKERGREGGVGGQEEVDLRVGLPGCQAGSGVGCGEEVAALGRGERETKWEGGMLRGRGLSLRPSELIGTAVLFYPPTERVVFGRHTSRRPVNELSRPVPPRQTGAGQPPPPPH